MKSMREYLYGLIFKCPKCSSYDDCSECNAPLNLDCIFCEIRKLPPQQRIEYIDNLSNDEIMKLYQYHSNCTNKK